MYQALIDESRKIGTFGHGFTYSGHPVAAAVALKTLEIYAARQDRREAARSAPQFQTAPDGARRPSAGRRSARHRAGRRASSCVADKASQAPFDAEARRRRRGACAIAEDEGLIVRFIAGDVISICPPMIIKPAEIDELFDKLARALDDPRLGEARAAAGVARMERQRNAGTACSRIAPPRVQTRDASSGTRKQKRRRATAPAPLPAPAKLSCCGRNVRAPPSRPAEWAASRLPAAPAPPRSRPS